MDRGISGHGLLTCIADDAPTVRQRIMEVFTQDRAERQLYGADVVDAYIDVGNMSGFVKRRLPYVSERRLTRIIYALLRIADTGGRQHV